MPKLPSFQFYPGDWMKDPALAICSAGARGVWMDVMCLMFESDQRGYLIANGKPWTLEQIAVALRGDWQENMVYLRELVSNGVMKRVEARKSGRKCPRFLGSFFCSRIVTDEVRREDWRAIKRRQRVEKKRSLSTPLSSLPSSSSSSSSSNHKSTQDQVVVEEVKRNTKNLSTASPLLITGISVTHEQIREAFEQLRSEPFGPSDFQKLFADIMFNGKCPSLTDAMERTIQAANAAGFQVPGRFFTIKHEVEKIETPLAYRKVAL